jgi:hypothetical protein
LFLRLEDHWVIDRWRLDHSYRRIHLSSDYQIPVAIAPAPNFMSPMPLPKEAHVHATTLVLRWRIGTFSWPQSLAVESTGEASGTQKRSMVAF